MSLYKGVSGKISYKKSTASETYLAHMTNWNVDTSKEITEQAYFGGSATEEGFNEKTPGVKNWTASADGAVDFGTASGQADLYQAYLDDEVLEFSFYLDANTALVGEGYIESISFTQSADGQAECSVSVSGNKVPELVTP